MHGEQRSAFERFARFVSVMIVDARLSMTSLRVSYLLNPHLLPIVYGTHHRSSRPHLDSSSMFDCK